MRTIAVHAEAVTASDTKTFSTPGWLFIGGAGNVKVDTEGGETITYNSVIAGTSLPVSVTRVYSTGTTATNMVINW